MYFVVFLIHDGINIIVPKTWIKDCDDHLEKFLNFGMNSSQNFLCYWTECPEAFTSDGQAKLDYPPDNNKGMANRYPETGWYVCKIKKCRSKLYFTYYFNTDSMLRANLTSALYFEIVL